MRCPTCCHYSCFQVTFQKYFSNLIEKILWRICRTWPSSIHPCVCFLPFQSWPKTLQPFPDQLPDVMALEILDKAENFHCILSILMATPMAHLAVSTSDLVSTPLSTAKPSFSSLDCQLPPPWFFSVVAIVLVFKDPASTNVSLSVWCEQVYLENGIFPDCGFGCPASKQSWFKVVFFFLLSLSGDLEVKVVRDVLNTDLIHPDKTRLGHPSPLSTNPN